MFAGKSSVEQPEEKENGKSKDEGGERTKTIQTPFSDYDFSVSSLSKFVPENFGQNKIKCLETLYLSGWNPVPFERRKKGNLKSEFF